MSKMTTEQITQAYREGYVLEDNMDKLNTNKMEYPQHDTKFGFMNPFYPAIDDVVPRSPRARYGFAGYSPSNPDTISLAAGSCPTDILRGTTKTLSVTLTTPTVGPYVVKFYVDGILKYTSVATSTFPHTFSNTFSEGAGPHIHGAEVTDSCPTAQGGPKTSARSECTVNILAPCATPGVTLTIPP